MLLTVVYVVSILALVAIDQIIKQWALAVLAPVGSMAVLPGILEWRFTLNTGMAFSLFSGEQTFLIVVTSIALVVVAYLLFFKMKGKILEPIAFVCIIGGGIGNLIDRIATGEVVDYINVLFMDFAIFNFADICVCVGAGLFILATLFEEYTDKDGADATTASADAPAQQSDELAQAPDES